MNGRVSLPALYLRVSDASQLSDESEGISTQIQSCRQSLRAIDPALDLTDAETEVLLDQIQPGSSGRWDSEAKVAAFWDGGISGTHTDRSGFQQLRSHILDGRVSHLVTFKVDRLMRPQEKRDIIGYVELVTCDLEEQGIEYWTEGRQETTAGIEGLLLQLLKGYSAGVEAAAIQARTQPARNKAFKQGNPVQSMPPYVHCRPIDKVRELINTEGLTEDEAWDQFQALGYSLTEPLQIDREHVNVILDKILPLAREGLSDYQVAKRLNADGVPPPSARNKGGIRGGWKANRFVNILSYKGDVDHGPPQGFFYRNSALESQPIEIHKPDLVIPELSPAVCREILTLLKANRKNNPVQRKRVRDWLLNRCFSRCPGCGSPLRAINGGTKKDGKVLYRHYYSCKNKDCRQFSVRAEVLEESFLRNLFETIVYGKLEAAYQDHLNEIKRGTKHMEVRLATIVRESKKVEAAIKNATRQLIWAAGKPIAECELRDQIDTQMDRLNELETEHQYLNAQLGELPPVLPEDYVMWVCGYIDDWYGMDYEEQWNLLRQVLDFAVPPVDSGGEWTLHFKGGHSVANSRDIRTTSNDVPRRAASLQEGAPAPTLSRAQGAPPGWTG